MADNRGGGSRSPRKVPAATKKVGPPRQRMSSLMYSLPVRRLKDILSHVLPDVTLSSTEELKSSGLARLFTLKMSDGEKVLLSVAPSLSIRLLRQESTILSTEAVLLNFLAESDLDGKSGKEKVEEGEDEEEDESSKAKDDSQKVSRALLGLAPKLLKHAKDSRELAYPYTIVSSTPGEPLTKLAPFLSVPERHDIDKQVGALARTLANLTSPMKLFGMANKALPFPCQPSGPSAPPKLGCKTWAEGFNTLLESILRDGEDMAVLLPYEVIRSHFARLSWRLDAVTTPRLAILDINDPKNVMIERDPDDEETMLPSEHIRLTGLRNWSQGVFGDPLIASCFDEPTEGFQEGWDAAGEEIIEDGEHSETRKLLYRCYRAIVEVVTEYYRPKGDSSRRELGGRRKLTQVLAQLEKVDVVDGDAPKRVRSSSTDGESSKRVKTESKGKTEPTGRTEPRGTTELKGKTEPKGRRYQKTNDGMTE
ncbi:uncharacterized protein LY89DRAFT_596020 [Mollisia scopiformis]|uniref:Aminoglycoside phosphotransferase domain-containing protein n=1 Tax=Mollisia scopiformis TaxID=149040 RepID=A0A194WRK3_MOLSC|nr:uncharacterized protein LY89DRAFT_596020 [Mollisia scopiformis]KUJ10633.1 hypothetical protein LY89DRAFT_596020 [Mollisia scopiformis]